MALKQPQKQLKTSKEAEKTCCRRMKSIKTRIETRMPESQDLQS